MQKGQKKSCWNKTRPPWEPWLHFCGSQDVRTWGLCVYPGPPFPCHRAGQETPQPQPGAFTAFPLTQETPVAAQQGEVTNFKEEEDDTCSFAWNHRFYIIGREGGRLKAPCLRSSFAPVTSSWGTGGWVNGALLASAQSWVLPLTSLFTTFCPSFMQLFGFCPCLSVEESPRWTAKERALTILFGGFFLAKPWLLFYKCPSDTYLCLRRLRNFCLSEMMSSVYPQPLYSESNCNQIPSCYPAFSTALTWQCHPL